MTKPVSREQVVSFFARLTKSQSLGSDGAFSMPDRPAAPAAAKTTQKARVFGSLLRGRLKELGVSSTKFITKAREQFPDMATINPGRWLRGERAPGVEARQWFYDNYGIDVPSEQDSVPALVEGWKRPQPQAEQDPALIDYAIGSLQLAIKATDEQLIHDVKNSLKDRDQGPWMRIAITLVRNALRQD